MQAGTLFVLLHDKSMLLAFHDVLSGKDQSEGIVLAGFPHQKPEGIVYVASVSCLPQVPVQQFVLPVYTARDTLVLFGMGIFLLGIAVVWIRHIVRTYCSGATPDSSQQETATAMATMPTVPMVSLAGGPRIPLYGAMEQHPIPACQTKAGGGI